MLVDFADELFTFLPTGTIPAIRADLDLSYAQAGTLLTLLPLGGIIGTTAMVAADFVSRRLLASTGALVYGACLLAFAFGDSFLVLALAAFTWGAASDAFVHGSQLALADLARDDLEATLARTNLLGSLGDLIAPIFVAASLATAVGWRGAFAIGGALMVGYAAWLAAQPLPPPRSDGATPWATIREVLRDRRVWWLAAFLGVGDTLDEPFLGFLVAYLATERGMSGATGALVVGSVLLGGVVGYARLAARPKAVPPGEALVTGSALQLVAVPALVLVPSLVVVAAAGFIAGVGGAIRWVALQASVLRLRPNQTGTTWAVVATLSLPALAVAPLVGVAADRWGLGTGIALYIAVPVAMLALLLVHPDRPLRSLVPWMRSSSSSRR